MTIILKDIPLNKSQKVELAEALQSIADLLVDAYQAGHDAGYDEGYDAGVYDEGENNERN